MLKTHMLARRWAAHRVLVLAFFIAASAAAWPPLLSSPVSSSAWTIVKGDTAAWKIAAAHLDCTVSESGPHWILSETPLAGDWVIEANLGPAFGEGEGLVFSAARDLSYGYLLRLGVTTYLYKISDSSLKPVTRWSLGYGTLNGVHSVQVLKKGATYRFSVDGRVLNTISNPGWEKVPDAAEEPDGGFWGFAFATKGTHTASSITGFTLPRAELFTDNPVLQPGRKDSWDQLTVFPAAVWKELEEFYLFYAGDYKPFPPGVYTEILHRIGVATSTDLHQWSKSPQNPVLGPPLKGDTVAFFDLSPSYRHATLQGGGGLVQLPNGHYGLTFNVGGDHQWLGIWLAESPSLLGQFRKAQKGRVLTLGGAEDFDGEHIHLHGAIKRPDGSYAILYTGFNAKYPKGRVGDRGGLATSSDMVHWTKYPGNPIFAMGETGSWDDYHVRPNTVARVGDWYYMFYEGAHPDNRWSFWPDQVGMARSKDLIHWERYPYNPILPLPAGKHFGNIANIQPAAVVSDGSLHVFYGCLDASRSFFAVCGATIPAQLLESWGSQ